MSRLGHLNPHFILSNPIHRARRRVHRACHELLLPRCRWQAELARISHEAWRSGGQLTFQSFDGRCVVAAFDGGAIASNAGALLLREADRVIGLSGRVARCFGATSLAPKPKAA
jgi:hypothetical protein